MCGRFAAGHLTQAQMLEIMERFLYGDILADPNAADFVNSWNIKPTQNTWFVKHHNDQNVLCSGRWWFVPHWFKGDAAEWKQTTFNARIETADQKPTFRTAWSSHRCIIPAIGYYEWTGEKGNKQPWFISAETNADVQWFAGLYSRLGSGLHTCTILTRPALPQIKHLHHRTPVILTSDELSPWIKGEITTTVAQNAMGTGWEGRMKFHAVNKIGRDDDGPELIDPIDSLL